MSEKIICQLDKVYDDFFSNMNIDSVTGIVNGTNKRFAAQPAIGKNYQNSNQKVLFISLDIGRDEKFVEKGLNTFQNFEERTERICVDGAGGKNPHMAGVYGISLYLLKDEKNWTKEWQILESESRYFREILNNRSNEFPDDVLSNVALLNFYNFVEVGRKTRSGSADRIFINIEKELQHLIRVINVLQPNKIVVHGKNIHGIFKAKIIPNLELSAEVFLVKHPSIIGRGIRLRNPRNYMEHLNENIIAVSKKEYSASGRHSG